jgi:hypothetical protein
LHIYAFGSVCRGEIDTKSDIDLLAIVDNVDNRFDPSIYSIYSYDKISSLWLEGNPFAWHLAIESKLIFSANGEDYIKQLGIPSEYTKCKEDCLKFYNLYCKALESISYGSNSLVFEMSTIFLAIRNFATCFLLGIRNIKNFSRHSALQMDSSSIQISHSTFDILERSRVLCVRGKGEMIDKEKYMSCINEVTLIKKWMKNLLVEVEYSG